MRASLLRLANASGPLPLSVTEASVQLIPPIPLYRRLLRAHRTLPDEMRFMGDSYVKSEFRLTRKTDNPLHIIAFLSQWKLYLDELEQSSTPTSTSTSTGTNNSPSSGGEAWRGRKLNMEHFEKLSNEQVGQLYELMHATKDVWKSTGQLQEEAVSAGVEGSSDSSRDKS